MRSLKAVLITSLVIVAGLVAGGCQGSGGTTPSAAGPAGPPVAPKTAGGNKPAVAGLGFKGTDLKSGGGDPGFGAKSK